MREAVLVYLNLLGAYLQGYIPASEVPAPPDVYYTYTQIKAFGALWWGGALADQPHILMIELAAVDEAVAIYERQQIAALEAQRNAK